MSEGIGEKLTALSPMPECVLLLAKPPIDVSTKMVYENLHANELSRHPDIDGMIEALSHQDLQGITKRMENVLETVTVTRYPVISEIKNCMTDMGAMQSLMSGRKRSDGIWNFYRERNRRKSGRRNQKPETGE